MPKKACSANSPLKNGLFVKKPLSNFLLKVANLFFAFPKRKNKIPKCPQRILLSNIANFGDVVISTTVLPVLKKHFPECELGFLVSNSSAVVLKNHPLISRVHTLDHWYLKRHLHKGLWNKCKAALHYRKSRRQIICELKKYKYEVAIDLYSYFPNTVYILYQAEIPIRIGYPTGGFSNLFTHLKKWDFQNFYTGYAHLQLLEFFQFDLQNESCLPDYHLYKEKGSYIAIHMGSSDPKKEWDLPSWEKLIHFLEEDGNEIVLTGYGSRELVQCEKIAKNTNAKNLCNQLAWEGFVRVIQEAKAVISVDSVAIHLAAAALRPTVALFTGINPIPMWKPPHSKCKALSIKLPCSPCFLNKGCEKMECIQKVWVHDVHQTLKELLGKEYLLIK